MMMDDQQQSDTGLGCLGLLLLFCGFALAGALVAMLAYILLVEVWGLITVPREWSYNMLLYAPLTGLVAGSIATLWAVRGKASIHRATVVGGLAALVGLILLSLFIGLGTIF
jgi:hypothetical protein